MDEKFDKQNKRFNRPHKLKDRWIWKIAKESGRLILNKLKTFYEEKIGREKIVLENMSGVIDIFGSLDEKICKWASLHE